MSWLICWLLGWKSSFLLQASLDLATIQVSGRTISRLFNQYQALSPSRSKQSNGPVNNPVLAPIVEQFWYLRRSLMLYPLDFGHPLIRGIFPESGIKANLSANGFKRWAVSGSKLGLDSASPPSKVGFLLSKSTRPARDALVRQRWPPSLNRHGSSYICELNHQKIPASLFQLCRQLQDQFSWPLGLLWVVTFKEEISSLYRYRYLRTIAMTGFLVNIT